MAKRRESPIGTFGSLSTLSYTLFSFFIAEVGNFFTLNKCSFWGLPVPLHSSKFISRSHTVIGNVGTMWGLRSGLLARYLATARLCTGHIGSQPRPVPKWGCEASGGLATILGPRARHRGRIKHLQKESSRAGAAVNRESMGAQEADRGGGQAVQTQALEQQVIKPPVLMSHGQNCRGGDAAGMKDGQPRSSSDAGQDLSCGAAPSAVCQEKPTLRHSGPCIIPVSGQRGQKAITLHLFHSGATGYGR